MKNQTLSINPLTTAGIVSSAALFGLLVYAWMPTVAADFTDLYIILLISAIPAVITMFSPRVVGAWVIALLALLLVWMLTTSAIIRADSYRDLLGNAAATDLGRALPPINIDQAPLVSKDMALHAMQKRLSELGPRGSQLSVAPPVKQLVAGKLVWVSFLDHSGFFKWYKDSATPGYLVVSAHDASDVRLVMEVGGKPLRMQYLQSAYGGDNVERHTYASGLFAVGLGAFEPEIDDDGTPFYVSTTYAHRVGFSGSDATGVVTVNTITGDVRRYSLGKEPAWIDRVQPEDFVREQMESHGRYVHGFINLNEEDVLRVEGDLDLVYGADGRAYWVSGMASTGKNSGLAGFYFVDSRSKAVRWFTAPSITQESAAHAVEGVMREKNYSATNALPFLVSGAPTYVMALRDDKGILRAFGMVDMRNINVMAVADTLAATLRSYQTKRSVNRVDADIGGAAQTVDLAGKVVRIASEFRNNQTMYYITLEPGDKFRGAIFTGSSDLSEELVLTKPGDQVKLSFSASDTRVVAVSKFHNLDIPTP
jgi:hypothetical protein